MNKIILLAFSVGMITLAACNNSEPKQANNMSGMKDTAQTAKAETKAEKEVTTVTPGFVSLDAKMSESIKTIVNHYLHIKNALANDNASEAANGGKAMVDAMAKVDKSLLTPEQKKVYDANEEDLKENAEHIDKNSGNIEHQREHFSMMSTDIYDLAKAFGGGQTLYHDH